MVVLFLLSVSKIMQNHFCEAYNIFYKMRNNQNIVVLFFFNFVLYLCERLRLRKPNLFFELCENLQLILQFYKNVCSSSFYNLSKKFIYIEYV